DPDFVIILRCDALLVHGLDEALARGRAYVAAGADVLFIESPRTMQEIETIARSFAVPLLYNMGASGKTPFLSAAELKRIGGWKIMILPNFATLAAIKAMREVLAEIRATGTAATVRDRCATFEDLMDLAGLPEVQAMERRYGLPEEAYTRM
ncbi:MAG: isocitrate lyase/phosphoenolpyruvate mutase family protein, partial [Chloroflexi bacterium]|nr:isocitrate lyase/phosphoenolpyruvate mutase family protein [Chloroflexota bacterium]